jgi:predicted transcriptional regulator
MPGRVPKEVTAQREVRAWELRQQLWTQQRIAEELHVRQNTVCEILKRVRKRVFAELQEEISEAKATQTAQLEYLANEAMDAWERSKLESVVVETIEEQVEVGEKKVPALATRTKTIRRGQSGNPSFLGEVRGALSDIRDIWGIEAPKRTDLTSDGKPVRPVVREVVIVRTGSEPRILDVTPKSDDGQGNGHLGLE